VALENIAIMEKMAATKQRSGVYAINSVYGKKSGKFATCLLTPS